MATLGPPLAPLAPTLERPLRPSGAGKIHGPSLGGVTMRHNGRLMELFNILSFLQIAHYLQHMFFFAFGRQQSCQPKA
jgi:hypothetical protein